MNHISSRSPHRRHLHRWITLLLALFLAISALPAFAAPPAQDEPTALVLGELAARPMSTGDVAIYTVAADEDALYVITTGDEQEAEKFDLIVSDADGQEIYNDILQTTELELTAGDYTLQVEAVEDGQLSLFVVAQLGEMTDDMSEPGQMSNGSFFSTQDVESTLYAKLTIAESDYWQHGFIVVQGGEDDSYSASVYGGDVYEYLSDSSEQPLLPFWTRGGEYDMDVTTLNGGGELTVMVLLSGPTPAITSGEPVEGELTETATEKSYQFEVSQAGAIVSVSVASEDKDADIDLQVSLNPANETWGSFQTGSNETLTFMAPAAGSYYVRVYSNNGPAAFTLTVEEGEQAPELPVNEVTWDTVPAGEVNIYRMEITEPSQMLSVILVGNPNVDLDLSMSLVNEEGESVHDLSSTGVESAEILAQGAAEAGMYAVTVNGSYASDDANYVLDVRLESPDRISGQWASEASASSQFGDDGYAASQATGRPNVTSASDNPLAWASSNADGSTETLELSYTYKVVPSAVHIYESYNPGAITLIEAYDEENDEWAVLWEGAEPTDEPLRIFSPELEPSDFATNLIRLTIESDLVPGWNEIDAVQLLGRP